MKVQALTINNPKSFGFKKQLYKDAIRVQGKGKIVERVGDVEIWLFKTHSEKIASAYVKDELIGAISAPASGYFGMYKLHQMFVDEIYRGRSIASALMKAVVTEPTLVDELMSVGFTKSLIKYFNSGKMIAFDTKTEEGIEIVQYAPKIILADGMEFEWGKIVHSARHDDYLLCIKP